MGSNISFQKLKELIINKTFVGNRPKDLLILLCSRFREEFRKDASSVIMLEQHKDKENIKIEEQKARRLGLFS